MAEPSVAWEAAADFAVSPEAITEPVQSPAQTATGGAAGDEPGARAQSGASELSPETIDAIARRVVEHLSERVVREIAWEVVPDLAERLIRRKLQEETRAK